jgi:hypothetical protein
MTRRKIYDEKLDSRRRSRNIHDAERLPSRTHRKIYDGALAPKRRSPNIYGAERRPARLTAAQEAFERRARHATGPQIIVTARCGGASKYRRARFARPHELR